MFGLSWTEVVLIGVVAMVLIGPKDLPIAVRAVADVVKKARRMAGEFQVHVDEMMKDADLKEMRDSISEIRRMDIAGDIRRHVDPDGSLKASLTEDPFAIRPTVTTTPLAPPVMDAEAAHEQGTLSFEPVAQPTAPAASGAPSFIPPGLISSAASEPAPEPEPELAPPAGVVQGH